MTDTTLPSLLPVSATGTVSTTADDRVTAAGDFDTFLTLLTAQLRNQDPLQPIDSSEFVAQLASFSTVEQAIGTNERLDQLIADATADDAAGLAAWLGAAVADQEGRLIATEEPLSIDVPVEDGADAVVLRLLDGQGQERAAIAPPMGGAITIDPVGDGVAGVGEVLRVSLRYMTGEEILVERPALVFSEVTSVAAGTDGPILTRADGLTLSTAAATALSTAQTEEP
ncbi:MAG: flagellar hook capping FlgD N-terminal domain-containing protein [Pseudomonadota bacterium]